MTAALLLAVLVALVSAVGCWLAWRSSREWERACVRAQQGRHSVRRDGAWSEARRADLLHERALVEAALVRLWHRVTPASPEEGAAVAVLRAAFPALSVPEGALLLAPAGEQAVPPEVEDVPEAPVTWQVSPLEPWRTVEFEHFVGIRHANGDWTHVILKPTGEALDFQVAGKRVQLHGNGIEFLAPALGPGDVIPFLPRKPGAPPKGGA